MRSPRGISPLELVIAESPSASWPGTLNSAAAFSIAAGRRSR
jgi:hypothetical protein